MKRIILIVLSLFVVLITVGCTKIKYVEKEVIKEVPVKETETENKFDALTDGETIFIRNVEEDFDFLKLVDPENKVYFYDNQQLEIVTKRPKISLGDNKFIVVSNTASKVITIHRNEMIQLYSNINDFSIIASFKLNEYEENQILDPMEFINYYHEADKYISLSCEPFMVTKDKRSFKFTASKLKESPIFYVDAQDGSWADGTECKIREFNVFDLRTRDDGTQYVFSDIYWEPFQFLSGRDKPKLNNFVATKLIAKDDSSIVFDLVNVGYNSYYCVPYKEIPESPSSTRLEEYSWIGRTLIAVYEN